MTLISYCFDYGKYGLSLLASVDIRRSVLLLMTLNVLVMQLLAASEAAVVTSE